MGKSLIRISPMLGFASATTTYMEELKYS